MDPSEINSRTSTRKVVYEGIVDIYVGPFSWVPELSPAVQGTRGVAAGDVEDCVM